MQVNKFTTQRETLRIQSQTSVSSVAQLCPTLCNPMNCSMPGLPVHHQLQEFTQTHVCRVGDAIYHYILCCSLLLLPSIFPSIRVFSNESVLCIRWPKYWSFSFSIIPSNKYSGLISFRMDWLDFPADLLKSLLRKWMNLWHLGASDCLHLGDEVTQSSQVQRKGAEECLA